MGVSETGIYVLGDDGAYDSAVALLESLRVVLPDVTLYCVPFSANTTRLSQLADRYRFTLIDDPVLAELDAIGREVMSHYDPPGTSWIGAATFRKFYTFMGPLERFLYMDADIVVFDGFPALLDRLLASGPGVRYAHRDLEMVYRAGPLRDRMVRDYGSPGINSGLWSGTKGLFTFDRVREIAAQSRADAAYFNARCNDQPFLNYALDVNRVPMQAFEDLIEGACAWAGDPRPLTVERKPDRHLAVRWPDGSPVQAIHWAGIDLHPREASYGVYRHFRVMSMTTPERLRWIGGELAQSLRIGASRFARPPQ